MVLAYKEQIEFLDRLKARCKGDEGLAAGYEFRPGSGRCNYRRRRALKALEMEQEPMIAAGIAASKTSAEAYGIAFKAWEARMEHERTRSEEARREKL